VRVFGHPLWNLLSSKLVITSAVPMTFLFVPILFRVPSENKFGARGGSLQYLTFVRALIPPRCIVFPGCSRWHFDKFDVLNPNREIVKNILHG